ncbi:tripartite tricarboxylate transporter substrate binding protein [Caenimonas aquaedulcis]|uniref:Tripartite tricarboxylate transporter substrate binding protein n=1 Tax=Caenimonas aquaedulcis TaxID=2793270 RepID=A0A931H848_9BURK|nr:tripartite tricarboxylate transporter substrate binding protein [Caenimonas aquaedulcis]MBG9390471.1 tripartite tricarboxylate transporter substrate binding protein [Caenimonas aquaedulcis]
MNRVRRTLVLAATALALSGTAFAQAWPSKPITLVVPYATGGATDIMARLVADRLREVLGQPIIVENRGGAAANIGAAYAAKAAPDGYTLLMVTNAHATNQALYKNLQYDLEKDFTPISPVATIPNILVVGNDVPAKDLREFIGLARNANPAINYASGGSGTSQHLAGALFNSMAHGKMVHVPYKQGSAAIVDVVGSRVEAYFGGISEVASLIDSGKLRALGVTTATRSPRYPNLPAISEVVPGYEIRIWMGLVTRAGSPPEAIARVNAAMKTILAEPEVRRKLGELGAVPLVSTPEEFGTFVRKEVTDLGKVVQLSGAKVE